jgi:hypothetical protein
VGRAALHDLPGQVVMPTNFAGRLRPMPDVSPRFACYVLASLYTNGVTRSAIKQTTGIQNLDLGTFLSVRVPRFPLPMQRAIADYLDVETERIDALLARKRHMIGLLWERHMSNVSASSSSVGSLVPLKRVARVRYGLGQPPPSSPDGVPIIRATNIDRGRITPRDLIRAELGDLPLDRAPLLREGEILVVRSGALTGDSALVTAEWAGCAPGYDLRVTPSLIDSGFLAHQMLASEVLGQILIARTRAAQPHLNAEDLGQVLVRSAGRSAERVIAGRLDSSRGHADAVAERLLSQTRLLVEHRQTLITAAVTGELEVSGVAA